MSFFRNRARRNRCGFTLVELLVVIVIIGVMALVMGPTFTTGSDVVRIKTASRGFMQMSRYARNMALLHQTPVELVFTSDGALSVVQVGGGGEGVVNAKAFSSTNAVSEDEALSAPSESAGDAGGETQGGGGASYEMADLNISKKYEQASFVFEGYSDTLDAKPSRSRSGFSASEEASDEAEDVKTCRVRYKSNGTCRPYRVRVVAAGDESFALTVKVDVLGAARIEEDEE